MKHRKLYAIALGVSLAIGSLLSIPSARAADPVRVVTGRITQMTQDQVTLDDMRSFKFDPDQAQCFDFRAEKTTCESLVAIGYADKARVTVVGDTVQRIDIIELQQ